MKPRHNRVCGSEDRRQCKASVQVCQQGFSGYADNFDSVSVLNPADFKRNRRSNHQIDWYVFRVRLLHELMRTKLIPASVPTTRKRSTPTRLHVSSIAGSETPVGDCYEIFLTFPTRGVELLFVQRKSVDAQRIGVETLMFITWAIHHG
jgi:hypothetical protein